MHIVWHGHSFFQITTSPEKNSQVKVAIDPYGKKIGLRVPKVEADVVLISHQHEDSNNFSAVGGSPFLIEGPGEYEIKNIFIQGILSYQDISQGKEKGANTIFTVESEGIKICHMGGFGQKELTENQLEEIGEVDILMIPVGGGDSLSEKEAAKIMSQLEPKTTIPMHYALPNLKMKLNPVSKFLKVFGIKSLLPINKLSMKKKDLSANEAKIVVLKK